MIFRKSRSIPKNDGLPVIRGKKVRRRTGSSVSRSPYQQSRDFSFLIAHFWKAAAVVAVLLLVLSGKDHNETSKSTDVSLKQEKVVSTPAAESPGANPPPPAPAPGNFPAQCTPAQFELVKKQLPDDPLSFRPWRDAGFSKATVRTDYAQFNPILAREFYASSAFSLDANVPFFGISFGWITQSADIPIDMLAIGSRDPVKYDVQSWNEETQPNTKKHLSPVSIDTSSGSRKAKYLVVEWQTNNQINPSIEEMKGKFGLSDDELAVVKGLTSFPAHMDHPIHFMDIAIRGGDDPQVLQFLLKSHPEMIKQTRFLHFQYNGKGAWIEGGYKLSKAIEQLKSSGLVCYFAGKKEANYGLWRITDCFLDYYDNPHWAGISCVNVQHDDVKILAERMEQKFLETIQQSHTFVVN